MFTRYTDSRKNETHQWCPSDSEDRYKPINSKGEINYSRDSFDYKFNSDGFRCDEFSEKSDFPILFMGCSFTEGIGLPLSDIWPIYFINELKKDQRYSDKNIPYHSLAMGGTGIDYAATALFTYIQKIKPKVVFYLLSSLMRREYCYSSTLVKSWLPNESKHFPKDISYELFGKVAVNPEFALYQTYRSLVIINQTAVANYSTVFVFDLGYGDIISEDIKIQLFSKFSNIKYVRLNVHYDATNFSVPDEAIYLRLKPLIARDNTHPGALWQYTVASKIKSFFDLPR